MNTDSANLESVYSPYAGARIEAYDFEEAFAEIDKLVRALSAKDVLATNQIHALSYHLNTRGFLHLQLGHFREGLADCLEARKRDANLDQDNLNLANLLFHHYESLILPQMAQLKNKLTTDACRKIANAYHGHGFYAHAAGYYHLAISVAKQSELAQLYDSLSASYLGSGLIIEAFIASARAVLLNPAIDKTNYLLSLPQIEGLGQDPQAFVSGFPDQPAMASYSSASEVQATGVDYLFARKYVDSLDFFNQKVDEARQQLAANNLNGIGQLLPGYLNHRATSHLNLRNFDLAIADCLEARSLDQSLGQNNLRFAQFFKAQYDTSLKPLFDALDTKISAAGYNDVGIHLHKNGFHVQAATYFQLAISISTDLVRAESYNNLAGTYFDAGYYIEALRAVSQAMAINPMTNRTNYIAISTKLKPMMLDQNALREDPFQFAKASAASHSQKIH
ncbi:hypothetical protein ACO0LM_07325 [Undibacterium sp. Di26W]|uniref:hypothetical protein n=1 Tax=Undibacterium sp. Di26W TaxID=3413035 RepID=UPI003BF12D86